MAGNDQTIIIKRVKKAHHAHHGGAWKIAYADFVTAMMAFFLLMWLINMTSPEQKQGLADYFAPASISETKSGSGGILGGKSYSNDGGRAGGAAEVVMALAPPEPPTEKVGRGEGSDNATTGEEVNQTTTTPDVAQSETAEQIEQESMMFAQAQETLRQAMEDLPELAELSKHIIMDETPEGLRIQIVDQEGRSMFPPGEAEPYVRTEKLLFQIAKIVNNLPNRITISGHTDAEPFYRPDGYNNWDLTADRANASRRILQKAGVPMDRVYQVSGKADTEPLFPDDPYMAANRRISIVLLREAPVLPPGHEP